MCLLHFKRTFLGESIIFVLSLVVILLYKVIKHVCKFFNMSLFGGCVVLSLVLYLSVPLYANVDENSIASARIESCKGCRLNHLPAVKAFVYEDVPLYEHVSFKPIPGASPVIIFSNKFDQELERIDLAPHSREACNDLLADRGFRKKSETVKEREDF